CDLTIGKAGNAGTEDADVDDAVRAIGHGGVAAGRRTGGCILRSPGQSLIRRSIDAYAGSPSIVGSPDGESCNPPIDGNLKFILSSGEAGIGHAYVLSITGKGPYGARRADLLRALYFTGSAGNSAVDPLLV